VLKRIIAVLATATLAIGLALGAAMPASAHDANYAATCGSLDLNLVYYGSGNNYVTVTIDGTKVEDNLKFKDSHTKSYSWSPASAHTFKIEIDAADAGYDKLGANAITGSFGPCTTVTTCINPLSSTLKNFTIVTSGSVTLNSTSHVTGTIAAGDDIVATSGYGTGTNEDGSALPVVDGKNTGVLVGDQIVLNASGEALKIDGGTLRVGNVGSGTASGVRFYPTSDTGKYVRMADSASIGDISASGLWNTTFGSAFSTLVSNSNTIAGYTASNVQLVSLQDHGGDGKKVKLVAGVTNVLRVSASDLAGVTKLFFDSTGASPSATTPFIIDVTSSSSPSTVPVIMNVDPHYVLWNFSKVTGTLTLKTSSGADFVRGSVLVPNGSVALAAGGLEGQIATKALSVTTGSEIHHVGYLPCATATSVSGAATTAAATCDTTTYTIANGSVTATVKTGVTYQLWNQAKTTKIADLTAGTAYSIAAGTYYVRVIAASSAYTVSSGNEWVEAVVGAYTGTCQAPQDVSGAATATAQTCDTNYDLQNGAVTASVRNGVTYQLWNQAKDTKIADLTAGTAYPVANGTYFVKVLPASGAYTVSVANTWIETVVGAYLGTCAESVSGAATSLAETCDTSVYEVKNGSVTATVKTGVTYQLWNQAKTNKIADLTAGTAYAVPNGTYYVRVIAASGKYTVSAGNEWIQVVVGKFSGICAQDVSGAATASAEICDANYDIKLGSVTATLKTGVTYQLWSADKGTKIADLTAGTAYPIGNGTYYVKVLPLTNKYDVTSANEWIQVSVGKYTGLCAQETSGSVTPSNETCQTTDWSIQKGSVVANTATGVTYELWNQAKTTKIADLVAGTPYALAHGDYSVRVLPLTSKYHVSSANEWIPVHVGEFTGVCAQDVSGSATPSAETCDTTDYSIAQGTITPAVVDGVRYELWTADKSTKLADLTSGAANKVDGGTYWVRVIATSTKYDVTSANEWIQQIVGDFTGTCAQDVKGSAVTAGETCSATDYTSTKPADYVVGLGSVTPGKADGVRYELWNQAKDTKIADLTAEQAYAVGGGTYFVKVLPISPKYDVTTANTWIEVVVPTNKKVCEVIGDPTKFEACVVNPNDLDDSNWTASLTIVAVDHVRYRVYLSDGTTWVDQGIWAAGTYAAGPGKLPLGSLVKVVAEPESGWSLLAPKDWTIQFAKGFDCDLSTNGVVDPNVVFDQTCSAGPTYKLTIDGGVAGSVLWSVNGGPTTTQLGTFSVAPGSTVKIVATPAPGAGFTGAGQAALSRTFEKTFTSGAECDLETLAFTGQDVSGYLVVAIILFQAGLALVAVQFVRARRKARHLAS
jgi:hypothetical protein